MVRRMESTEANERTTRRGVLLCSNASNHIWGSIEGIGGLIGITGVNVKVLVRNQFTEKSISRYGQS